MRKHVLLMAALMLPCSTLHAQWLEQELQAATDPWVPTRFEFRDKVTPNVDLAIRGEVVARPGDAGEIEKVLRDAAGGPAYHARFNGRTLLVPESTLEPLDNVAGGP